MAAGAIVLSSSGKRILTASGNRLVSDGAGNRCCCQCEDCERALHSVPWCDCTPRYVTMVASGISTCAGCLISNPGGTGPYFDATGITPPSGSRCLEQDPDTYSAGIWWWREAGPLVTIYDYSGDCVTPLDTGDGPWIDLPTVWRWRLLRDFVPESSFATIDLLIPSKAIANAWFVSSAGVWDCAYGEFTEGAGVGDCGQRALYGIRLGYGGSVTVSRCCG